MSKMFNHQKKKNARARQQATLEQSWARTLKSRVRLGAALVRNELRAAHARARVQISSQFGS